MQNALPWVGGVLLDRDLLHSCGDFITRHRAVPLQVEGNRLRLGMLDPQNEIARDDFNLIMGFEIDPVAISADEFALVEEYLRHDPPEVFSMNDFPEEAYQHDSAEAATNADRVLEKGREHRQIRVVPVDGFLLCYYDDAEHPLLRYPPFVRNAFYRRWKQQAGLSPDHPSPCQGRLSFQDTIWTLEITSEEEATLGKVSNESGCRNAS